jgi:hypothetical protein
MTVRTSVSRRVVLGIVATLAALATVGATAGGAAAATKQKACPTFRVVKPDPAAGYAAGVYDMSVSGPISCRSAVRLFIRYLDDPQSGLPKGWAHRRYYAGFSNGRAAFNVFRPDHRHTHHRHGRVRLCSPDVSVFQNHVGFFPGVYALLVWGKTKCSTAHSVFTSYVEGGGIIPRPYKLNSTRTAFSAGRSGFQVSYREPIVL